MSATAEISLLTLNETEECNYQYVVLEVDDTLTKVSRDTLAEISHAENVFARCYFYPGCHNMEPYRSDYPDTKRRLANTECLVKQVMSLPTGTAIGSEEIGKTYEIIRLAIIHGREVDNRLSQRTASR